MREIMPSHADDSPESRPLREVFHIERGEMTMLIADRWTGRPEGLRYET